MPRPRALRAVAALALVVLLAGCKDRSREAAPPAPSASASVPPTASASTLGAADASVDRRPRGLRGGRSAALFEGAHALEGLEDGQKAKIDEAEKKDDVEPATRDAIREGARELNADLVAGIKAGKIDMAKLEPRFAAMERSIEAQHDREMEALAALHAALDPAQRKSVIASARAKEATRDAREAERREATADAGKPTAQSRRRLERMTRDLDLDAEQQKKVAALTLPDAGLRSDHAEQKKQRDSLYAAFEQEKFEASKVESFDTKKLRSPIEEEAKLLAAVLPILKPEQRQKLASKVESGRGGPGGRRLGRPHGKDSRRDDAKDDDDEK